MPLSVDKTSSFWGMVLKAGLVDLSAEEVVAVGVETKTISAEISSRREVGKGGQDKPRNKMKKPSGMVEQKLPETEQ